MNALLEITKNSAPDIGTVTWLAARNQNRYQRHFLCIIIMWKIYKNYIADI